MINKIVIYGERCSGTNYLEQLLLLNFNVEITFAYGWKHFFGFNDLSNTDGILFIGIVRNLVDWINSLYREKYHLPSSVTLNEKCFFNNEMYSISENGDEIMEDRHIDTHNRYKNIFELRHIKNKFLIEKMPLLVKNYCLITYDELMTNFENVMNRFQKYNLTIKNDIHFPLNIYFDSKNNSIIFNKKTNTISYEQIKNKANLYYEDVLFPNFCYE